MVAGVAFWRELEAPAPGVGKGKRHTDGGARAQESSAVSGARAL